MNNMKSVLLLLCSCFIIMLGSCGVGRVFFSSEDKKADARLKDILVAIREKDKDDIRRQFSVRALKEDKNIEDGIEYLLDFFQGEVKSWKIEKWSSGDRIRDGRISQMIRAWFEVETDIDTYSLFIIVFPARA